MDREYHNRSLLSPKSGGWKSKAKVWARVVLLRENVLHAFLLAAGGLLVMCSVA